MGDISSKWRPLKYCLESNFDFWNKKAKQRIVKKAMKVIDNVLENVAPGQVEKLKVKCFQQDKEQKEKNELFLCLCKAISEAQGRDRRIQLLSIIWKKDSDGKYLYSHDELLDKFKGITLDDVKQVRKHASNDKAGIPIKPGHYSRKKLSNTQVNHFLDFLLYGGVMQDDASGTRSLNLSTGRTATVPKAVGMVYKAEIIRLYTSACDKEGCTIRKVSILKNSVTSPTTAQHYREKV